MTSLLCAKATDEVAVGMGQAIYACDPTRLTTILGSCVAVTLYSHRRRAGMLSHVVLPQAKGNSDYPGKFADTALPHMLSTLRSHGIGSTELSAKLVGGACMFGNGQFAQIGNANVQAVTQALEAAKIPIVGREVQGNSGRRMCFDLATGSISVTSVGHSPRII
jgi:chemotaxis protein CheD